MAMRVPSFKVGYVISGATSSTTGFDGVLRGTTAYLLYVKPADNATPELLEANYSASVRSGTSLAVTVVLGTPEKHPLPRLPGEGTTSNCGLVTPALPLGALDPKEVIDDAWIQTDRALGRRVTELHARALLGRGRIVRL